MEDNNLTQYQNTTIPVNHGDIKINLLDNAFTTADEVANVNLYAWIDKYTPGNPYVNFKLKLKNTSLIKYFISMYTTRSDPNKATYTDAVLHDMFKVIEPASENEFVIQVSLQQTPEANTSTDSKTYFTLLILAEDNDA